MASLLAKDAYLQDLARKICAPPGPEPPRRARADQSAQRRRQWQRRWRPGGQVCPWPGREVGGTRSRRDPAFPAPRPGGREDTGANAWQAQVPVAIGLGRAPGREEAGKGSVARSPGKRSLCVGPGPRGLHGAVEPETRLRPPKKKRKKTQKKFRAQEQKTAEHQAGYLTVTSPGASGAKKPAAVKEEKVSSSTGAPAASHDAAPESVFALDVLRQRLHEKIQQARGQACAKELSAAALEKRRRRKQERDRRKRKRRELRAKEKAAQAQQPEEPEAEAPSQAAGVEQPEPAMIFSKVEVSGEEPASKAQRRKEKRQQVKGNLTPLTGRNYRQLLERLQARRGRLAELREQDAGKARELEAKMQWTNLLYKAEGVRVRDDEHLLREALKRKEKRRAQRQRRWEKRSAHVVAKMQQRQDRRRQNLRKKKAARAERRLQKARRKGRVLPQDLERAGLS
ncbi:surfeit locus protein 6 [Ctenodactylus gundi]